MHRRMFGRFRHWFRTFLVYDANNSSEDWSKNDDMSLSNIAAISTTNDTKNNVWLLYKKDMEAFGNGKYEKLNTFSFLAMALIIPRNVLQNRNPILQINSHPNK